jgi:hypothetical protein
MKYMVIKTFTSRMEAEVAKSFLTAQGIDCLISSDDQTHAQRL